MEDNKQIMLKSYVMYILVAVAMVVVIGRVIAIQYGDVAPRPNVSVNDTIGEMPTRIDSIQPMRGRILSDDGSDLVTSIPIYKLHMDVTVVKKERWDKNVDSLGWYLAQVFPKNTVFEWRSALRKARDDRNKYFPLHSNVKYDVLQRVREFPILKEGQFKGGFIEEKESKRQMPYGLLAKRTLGSSQREGAMDVGLEGAFDKYLSGEYGLIAKHYISNGWKPVSGDYMKDPIPGADIVTSIDIDIQDVAENELKKQLEAQEALYGSVVLMEVETGFVKAIANLKRAGDGEYYESYNHAVGLKTDPGSTFKLATLMALLEDGKVSITDSVNAVGKYDFYTESFVDSNPWGYGKITIQRAFEVSSNVFSKIANRAYYDNEQKFVDRLKSFGLGDKLGLDIAGEPKPTLKNVGEDGWSGITLPWMSIGYEVEITPIQTLAFYNAVANNGELVRPQFVTEVIRDGKVIKTFEKDVLNEQICSPQTIESLKICLEGVVERGTGEDLEKNSFKIAGKTGTAKLANGALGYTNHYQASFAGYFPADKPKYSCIVVIAGPTKQIYGAQVSGTVFASIASKVYSSSLEYHPNYNGMDVDKQTVPMVKTGSAAETIIALNKMRVKHPNNVPLSGYVKPTNQDGSVLLTTQEIDKTKVPNVKGMPLNDAVYLLENMGMKVRATGSGKVIQQSLAAGKSITNGETIKLVLG